MATGWGPEASRARLAGTLQAVLGLWFQTVPPLGPLAVALGATASAQLDIRSQPSGDSPAAGLGPIPTPPPRALFSVNCSSIHVTPRPASLTRPAQDLVRFWGAAYTAALDDGSCLSFLLHSPALSREKDTLRAVVSRASPAARCGNHGCLHSWARRI